MKKDWKKKRRFRQSFACLLQKVLRKPYRKGSYNGPRNSLVILAQEKFGDAILLTPLLKNLKTLFPGNSVTVITFSKAVFGFFQSDPHVDAIYYTKGNPVRYISSVLFQKFDILFNTKDHPSTNFLLQSLLVPARCKIGIQNKYHTGIYDYLVKADFHAPIALKNCGLLELLGADIRTEQCRPYIPPMTVSESVSSFVASMKKHTFTGINISAGLPTRQWTEKNWRQLVGAFPGEMFIVLSAPGDIEQKKSIEKQCGNVFPSPETKNLHEANLILEKLKLLVTPDTAMVHVASCANTPVIGLYGQAPQDQSRFAPFLIDYRMVISATSLVRDIEPEKVIDALRETV